MLLPGTTQTRQKRASPTTLIARTSCASKARLGEAEAERAEAAVVAEASANALRTLLHIQGQGPLAFRERLTVMPQWMHDLIAIELETAYRDRDEMKALAYLVDARTEERDSQRGAVWPRLSVAGAVDYANPNDAFVPPRTRERSYDEAASPPKKRAARPRTCRVALGAACHMFSLWARCRGRTQPQFSPAWFAGRAEREMAKQKIGIIGSGQVGKTLAAGFVRHGHEVMLGTRDTSKLDAWCASEGKSVQTGSFAEAAGFGDLIVLAVLGRIAGEVVDDIREQLTGKTVLDASNPIAEQPPENGVLRFFTGPNESLMEQLQGAAPDAHFVKAFSCVGSPFMVNPEFPDGQPTMFICGDSEDAKAATADILDTFGWNVADMGGVQSARAIEPLCMLWCIPGLRHDSWTHAFKLLRL